jgi:hypothetical protein
MAAARARRVAGIVGGALGAVLLASVFVRPERTAGGLALVPRFQLDAFADALPRAGRWLAPYLALCALLPFVRAAVWRVLLPPPPVVRWADAWHATALGALLHNAVPGKGGPAAAALALARFTGRPFGAALSSQLLAKLVELAATMVLAAGAQALPRGAVLSSGGLWRGAAAGGAVVVVLAALLAALRVLAPRAAARLGGRPRLAAVLRAVPDGLAALRTPQRVLAALALAAVPPLVAAAAYAAPLAAAGVRGPFVAGLLVVAVLTVGQLTPGLPVGAGVHYALAAWAARSLGAAAPEAAALAMLTHAGGVAAAVTIGLASAVARRHARRALWAARRGPREASP